MAGLRLTLVPFFYSTFSKGAKSQLLLKTHLMGTHYCTSYRTNKCVLTKSFSSFFTSSALLLHRMAQAPRACGPVTVTMPVSAQLVAAPDEFGSGTGIDGRPSVDAPVSVKSVMSHNSYSSQHDIPLFRPFGQGFIEDLKTKLPWYSSDITDGFSIKTFITVLYLFWGAIANAVAFGALLGANTDGEMGATETLLATAALGMLYPLLCGQPLTVMGSTGPIAAYIIALRTLCISFGMKFLPLYAWSGLFLSFYLFLGAMFSLSNAIRKVTRFTEELFSVLISVIYIYSAMSYFITLFADENTSHGEAKAGLLIGFLTCFTALTIRGSRNSSFCNQWVRNRMADFSPVIAIGLGLGLAW